MFMEELHVGVDLKCRNAMEVEVDARRVCCKVGMQGC